MFIHVYIAWSWSKTYVTINRPVEIMLMSRFRTSVRSHVTSDQSDRLPNARDIRSFHLLCTALNPYSRHFPIS